jgi:hypothetical protein
VGMNVHTYSYLKDSHQKVFKTEKATLWCNHKHTLGAFYNKSLFLTHAKSHTVGWYFSLGFGTCGLATSMRCLENCMSCFEGQIWEWILFFLYSTGLVAVTCPSTKWKGVWERCHKRWLVQIYHRTNTRDLGFHKVNFLTALLNFRRSYKRMFGELHWCFLWYLK